MEGHLKLRLQFLQVAPFRRVKANCFFYLQNQIAVSYNGMPTMKGTDYMLLQTPIF